jgi:hypothetical protein
MVRYVRASSLAVAVAAGLSFGLHCARHAAVAGPALPACTGIAGPFSVWCSGTSGCTKRWVPSPDGGGGYACDGTAIAVAQVVYTCGTTGQPADNCVCGGNPIFCATSSICQWTTGTSGTMTISICGPKQPWSRVTTTPCFNGGACNIPR